MEHVFVTTDFQGVYVISFLVLIAVTTMEYVIMENVNVRQDTKDPNAQKGFV